MPLLEVGRVVAGLQIWYAAPPIAQLGLVYACIRSVMWHRGVFVKSLVHAISLLDGGLPGHMCLRSLVFLLCFLHSDKLGHPESI